MEFFDKISVVHIGADGKTTKNKEAEKTIKIECLKKDIKSLIVKAGREAPHDCQVIFSEGFQSLVKTYIKDKDKQEFLRTWILNIQTDWHDWIDSDKEDRQALISKGMSGTWDDVESALIEAVKEQAV